VSKLSAEVKVLEDYALAFLRWKEATKLSRDELETELKIFRELVKAKESSKTQFKSVLENYSRKSWLACF
jgi:ribosome-binding protein aMBF1 (putative translation factor)